MQAAPTTMQVYHDLYPKLLRPLYTLDQVIPCAGDIRLAGGERHEGPVADLYPDEVLRFSRTLLGRVSGHGGLACPH